ncbi:hypothetical protein [Pantanalinema sp. GBBB05]|uniref:hypothetical protein n=1 Tax=Pantanalinema sp. GBBB05 TaxID=2604139 RepID=UPI001D5B4F0A|nr:hypothetical protein [Pantanalinema sp. GBBB05]
MRLQLKYPPTAENAPKFAADMVSPAAEMSGANLDYSVASLQAVDDIIECMRQDGCTPDQVAETLFGFGCYVGEVFVQRAGGRWRNAAETSMAKLADFPMVIELGKESFCSPIDKVFKRMESGEDNLPYFYQVFTARG